MQHDEIRRRSHWIIRAIEWDDAKARYPNLWYEGMPRHLLVLDRVAHRVRLGDLVAAYYPSSQRHPERADRYLGISRVVGVRRADPHDHAWIDLETAHRFEPPLRLERSPHRVFLCCDPGWPAPEVELFEQIVDAAQEAGWKPAPGELTPLELPAKTERRPLEPPAPPPPMPTTATDAAVESTASQQPAAASPAEAGNRPEAPARRAAVPAVVVEEGTRLFAGADLGSGMRDRREETWLAVVGLVEDRLRIVRLEATGRSGLQSCLRDPDRTLMSVESIGLDFPFSLPAEFGTALLEGEFPEEGWWNLVKRLEGYTRPGFLSTAQDFRDERGELRRLTDEAVDVPSPLNREGRDLSSSFFHGIRMIGEDRSRYAIRPFESAQGRLLLEVRPEAVLRALHGVGQAEPSARLAGRARDRLLDSLGQLDELPLELDGRSRRICRDHRGALFALVAARCAARAVLTGEVDATPEQLAPGSGDRVRREGWIYGLTRSPAAVDAPPESSEIPG